MKTTKHYELVNDEAIIPIKDKTGDIIENVVVPKARWHELMLHSWTKTYNYYFSYINGKVIKLHCISSKSFPI